jgi:hypothetical protein
MAALPCCPEQGAHQRFFTHHRAAPPGARGASNRWLGVVRGAKVVGRSGAGGGSAGASPPRPASVSTCQWGGRRGRLDKPGLQRLPIMNYGLPFLLLGGWNLRVFLKNYVWLQEI